MTRRPFIVVLLLAGPLLAQTPFQEQITVERIIIDAHVTKYDGTPITGLTAGDFKVKVDGKTAEVESSSSGL